MLVLSRGYDEIIRIGDDIQIKVLDIRDHTVRLGITAPRELGIHRNEVYERNQQKKLKNETAEE